MKGLYVTMLLFSSSICVAQVSAPRPWQRLQSSTAAQVLKSWKTPPPEYGPEPYYGLNGAATLDTVRHDLDNMQHLGYTAVTVQYGSNMAMAYLSPEYLTFFKGLVAEAKKRDMRVWIVDDAGYPSGFAGGKFTALHPELRMQALVTGKPIAVAGGASFDQAEPAYLVAATAISTNGETVQVPIHSGQLQWTAPTGADWMVYEVVHDFRTSPTRSDTNPNRVKDGSQSLEDYMDPAATAQYLQFTHEAYKAAVGDEFGKTILGFRGDEPDYSINGLPWTPKFFASFEQKKGYDIRPYVAAFLQPKDTRLTSAQAKAKADYYDVFADLFRDGFFKPQSDWCRVNGLEYQVHLNHEEMELQLVHSEGDFFRDMRYVQIPGIDSIWHQIWTDTISDFPRLASSAAHVYGHPRAFTESFAAYRPAPDITMARYILNEQMVRGINLVETMYYPATISPNGGGPSTMMKDPAYPALLEYTRRLSYLMAMGRPAASVALLLPVASLWMGDAQADNTFVSTERLLSERQVDFDIVDEDALNGVLKQVGSTLETRSGNRYSTLVIPGAQVLSRTSLERLQVFAKAGGKVLFVAGTPGRIAGRTYLNDAAAMPQDFSWAVVSTSLLLPTPTPPAQPPTTPLLPQEKPADLLETLSRAISAPELELKKADPALKSTHRRWNDATVFLLFNESDKPLSNSVSLRAKGNRVEVWDPQTGTVAAAASTRMANGKVELSLRLAPYATEVIVVR